MVLTEEEKTDAYPPASMPVPTSPLGETAQATTEEALYANLSQTRVAKPAGYPNDTYTNPNNYVAKTNGSGNKIGPSIILKVMGGDKFNIRVSSWYKKNGVSPNSPNSIATDLVSSLINSLTGAGGPVHGAITSAPLTTSGVMPTSVNDFLSNQPDPGSSKPKAYLNWVLLDEQFKFVASGSGAEQVGNDNTFTVHTKTDMPITKSGYLYVFVSNETPNIDVFFDNLQVTHIRGPILEETHYYPFGLTMAGISSKALSFGGDVNKIKFQNQEMQNKEFSDGTGLEMYQFKYRMHDPQIGRFWQIDPLADKYVYNSTYAFSENKVVNAIELEGLESVIVTNIYDKDKQLIGTSTTYYFNDEDYGPLGKGTYSANKYADGTFSEEFSPVKGNSVNGFYANELSQSRWTDKNENFGGFETRLNARLIEKQAEDGLVSLGFDIGQVQDDIVVLETDNPALKGKFAGFASDAAAKKYTHSWSDRYLSDAHKSTNAIGSGPIGSSGIELKFYDGAKSKYDAYPSHMDMERYGLLRHILDYMEGKYGSGNPGLSNAKNFKNYQEDN